MAVNGFIDHLSNVRIRGWAKAAHGKPVSIAVILDGQQPRTGRADIFRADVGPHGFDLFFDPPFPVNALVTVKVDDEVLCTGSTKPWYRKTPVKHRLRAPLYASPFLSEIAEEEQWEPARKEMLSTFSESGLLRIKIERPDFHDMAERLKRIDYQGKPRIQDGWRDNADVRALACDPTVLRVLKQLYGREPVPMQTLNFPVGTQQSSHTDALHFNSQPAHFMCGAWVAFEPVGHDNGPLHYYPGSNNLPIVDLDDIGALADESLWSDNYEYHQEMLRELLRVRGLKREIVIAEPGDAIIWAANLCHGGEPISKPGATRHTQVTHYYFEGCSYYTPMRSNVHLNQYYRESRPDIRTGGPLKHFFDDIELPFTSSTPELSK